MGLFAPRHVGFCWIRDQTFDPRLLPWQADSLPLSHQGTPHHNSFYSVKVDSLLKGKLHLPAFMILFPRKRFALLCCPLHALLSQAPDSHVLTVVPG